MHSLRAECIDVCVSVVCVCVCVFTYIHDPCIMIPCT